MEMTDGAHVPRVDGPDGIQRFVWDLPHAQILIDVHPDGRVEVNGRPVEVLPSRVPSRVLPRA